MPESHERSERRSRREEEWNDANHNFEQHECHKALKRIEPLARPCTQVDVQNKILEVSAVLSDFAVNVNDRLVIPGKVTAEHEDPDTGKKKSVTQVALVPVTNLITLGLDQHLHEFRTGVQVDFNEWPHIMSPYLIEQLERIFIPPVKN